MSLLISGSRVRVPEGAPKQKDTDFPCLFVLAWRQDRAGRAERGLFVCEALCAAGASPRKVHPCLFVLAWRQDRAGRAERELFVLAQRALRRRRKPPEGAPVSFCFGVAAGPSGSRGARAVRARTASFAPQAQAPGRCTVGSVSFCFGVAAGPSGSRGARAVRARAASFAPQAQAPGRRRGQGRKSGGLTNRRSGDRIKVQKIIESERHHRIRQ